MNDSFRARPDIFPATLIGRLTTALVAAGLAVVGVFFIAFAVTAVAAVAAIVAIRIWWVVRKLRAQRDADVIEGSYSVEAREISPGRPERVINETLPPYSK